MLHNLIAVTGPFGSGKSLAALETAITLCDKFHKSLVVNFDVDPKAIRLYSRAIGKKWFASSGRIIRVSPSKDGLNILFARQHTVCVFDEGGVFTNSRSWSSLDKGFLENLFQIRKLDIHLLVIFQFQEQVDKQIRLAFQHWIVCKSAGMYSRKLQAPRIYQRLILHYNPEKFWRLDKDVRARGNIILPYFWSESFRFRFMFVYELFHEFQKLIYAFLAWNPKVKPPRPPREQMLFKCFKSTGLVDKEVARQRHFANARDGQYDYHFNRIDVARDVVRFDSTGHLPKFSALDKKSGQVLPLPA